MSALVVSGWNGTPRTLAVWAQNDHPTLAEVVAEAKRIFPGKDPSEVYVNDFLTTV